MATKKKTVVAVPLPLKIREEELAVIQVLEAKLKKMRAEVRMTEALLAQNEKKTMDKLKAGAVVEGRFSAAIIAEPGQCRPEWKTLYVDHMGAEHGMAEEAVIEKAREWFPAQTKEVLVVGVRSDLQLPFVAE